LHDFASVAVQNGATPRAILFSSLMPC